MNSFKKHIFKDFLTDYVIRAWRIEKKSYKQIML